MSAKQYKYTKDNIYLTDEQRDFYEKNGYIVFRNLVDHKLLDECKQRFTDICNKKIIANGLTVMKDASLMSKNVKGEYLIYKIQDFAFDDIFFKYVSYKPIVDIVQSIIGSNITGFHSMLVNKPPNSSRHPLHQDLHYFPFRPAESIVASWTAMEKIDERNGCLFVTPGSHKDQLYKHDNVPDVNNKAFYGVLDVDHLPKVNLVMEKGDTVFFHPLLLHGSGPNLTKGFRKAISCHYADSNCYFIDLKGTTQEIVLKLFEEIIRKKIPGGSFDMLVKLKCRLVRGNPGNFQKLDSQL